MSRYSLFGVYILNGTTEEMITWADSISTSGKTSLITPWNNYFKELGKHPLCQQLQRNGLEPYWKRAIDPICKNYGLKTFRGMAMAFDIAVNLWSLGDAAYEEIMSQVTPETTERELLLIMSRYGSETTRPRREAIANGTGFVNGEFIDLDTDFGLSDEAFR